MPDWFTATLPLFGVALGAALQFWFTRSSERDKHTESLRAQAYVDYLRAAAAAAHARAGDGSKARHDAADAKARIAVYGSEKVIAALARFEESGPIVRREQPEPFLAVVAAMRLSAVSTRDLEAILLGPPKAAAAASPPS
jgi:hypothetical protein